ncbi:hypothetical protein NECAME_12993 [Necator americanus]|uniref:Bestrophin homolog n=1 Tax=Necator americanus TaxID=51031 RepID=W2SXG6_NECAM|nr:hypothetical protein NECAME_12993 [Necator americanus]ETN74444.1 hypothetical protein NECAME_12993 [Necator americanus]
MNTAEQQQFKNPKRIYITSQVMQLQLDANKSRDGANDEAYCSVLVQLDSLPVKASLSVLLGFTARTCMNRWMEVYKSLMWPEGLALMFNSFFDDDALPPATSRAVRHSVYRYLLLCYILILRDISISVKKQFPTYKHLIKAKLLTKVTLRAYYARNLFLKICAGKSEACNASALHV